MGSFRLCLRTNWIVKATHVCWTTVHHNGCTDSKAVSRRTSVSPGAESTRQTNSEKFPVHKIRFLSAPAERSVCCIFMLSWLMQPIRYVCIYMTFFEVCITTQDQLQNNMQSPDIDYCYCYSLQISISFCNSLISN